MAIEDSIPYDSPEDCPGCTGFVDRYADSLHAATDCLVDAVNLSRHDGVTLPMLLEELNTLDDWSKLTAECATATADDPQAVSATPVVV